ncbi:mediator of RNA polymerase II transcription subunit 16 isoform X1 [Brachionus plicatilis]|uniref:Mediator of RNA polymerase II transcription subunit 16 isoform X1 n=1 Tax=Brachionus plicatilis TaxID=10195 RepID=A0A3M7TA15_BRAPC|nr:mediator of RNA polymerase II transcription subunit 16 isoform X1 [Brachionus plicatilis]
MDYVYLVDLKDFLTKTEINPDSDYFSCVVSSLNVVALSANCCVYILPLEKPNELKPVTLSKSPCIHLAWSHDGQYLLSFFKNGQLNIFKIKTCSLDSIKNVFSSEFNFNDILAIKAFSKASKICFSHDKKDPCSYFEKFCHKKIGLMNTDLGIMHDGFLILTKTGTLHFIITESDGTKNQFKKLKFDLNLNDLLNNGSSGEQIKFDLGDFYFEEDGSINVILSHTDTRPVFLFRIDAKYSMDELYIVGTTNLIGSLNLPIDLSDLKTHLVFTSHESAQSFCVAFKSNTIQFYKLDQNFSMIRTIQCPSTLTGLSVPKSYTLYKDLVENRLLTDAVFIIASYQNGSQGFIDILTFNQINIPTELTSIRNDLHNFELSERSNLSKKIKFPHEFLIQVDQSCSGLIGVGLTNLSRLAVCRNPFFINDQNIVLNHLFDLYEYTIFSGHDYWDLMMTTNPKFVDNLIESLEDKFNNHLSPSMQKIYFSRHHSLMFSLYKRSRNHNYFRSQDILIKLILNRIMSIISFSVQFSLNVDQMKSSMGSASSLSTSQLVSVVDTLNQPTAMFSSSILNQTQFKNNLLDFLNEVLKVKPDAKTNFGDLKQLALNDIVAAILSRKNYQLCVNQQLKHVLQWVIDLALYLINVVQSFKFNHSPSHFGLSLLNDLWFLNEVRKVIVVVKLMISYNGQHQTNASHLLINSVPVLPVKSSMQKDFLSELFKLYSNIIQRIIEGSTLNDESVIDSCLTIQAETIIRPMDELLFKLKFSWLGSSSDLWTNTIKFPVDHLFDNEKHRQIYPLFDIIRLIQFSRSPITKQCIRCGNYTEANSNQTQPNTKKNCIFLQDSSGEKCFCGGYFVLSN